MANGSKIISGMNKITSSILRLNNPRDLIFIKERIDVSKLKDDEILGKTIYTAISPGTELAAYKGDSPLRPGKVYPRLLGYCNLAKVIAKGKNVKNYDVGDLILSFESHRTHFISKEKSIILKVDKGTDLAKVSTTYLYHLAYNALLKGEFIPGKNVAIIGLGTLGMCAVDLSSALCANVVIISGKSKKLDIFKDNKKILGIQKNEKQIKEKISAFTKGVGLDIVITTSNSWNDWQMALEICTDSTKICLLGFPGRGQDYPDFNPLASQYIYDKQLSIIACGYSPDYDIPPKDIRFTIKRNCEFLLNLIINKKLEPGNIITDIQPYKKIEEIYEKIEKNKMMQFTYVLKWDDNE